MPSTLLARRRNTPRLRTKLPRWSARYFMAAPLVGLARAAALACGLVERSTLARLTGASQSALLSQKTPAYWETLSFLAALAAAPPNRCAGTHLRIDNRVDLAELSTLERRHLKESFVTIKQIQADVRTAWRLDDLS